MKQVWNQTTPFAKLALIIAGVGLGVGVYFLWVTATISGYKNNPPAPPMIQLIMGLFAIIALQAALYVWNRDVLPGLFLAMCQVTRALGNEESFVEACHPVVGDGARRIAQRAGLRGLLRAFQYAKAK